MTRLSRLAMPALVAVVLLALWWFARENRGFIADLKLEPQSLERVLLFFACIPSIFFLVRLVDLVAFDIVASRRKQVHAPMLLREIVSIGLYLILFAWAISTVFEYKVVGFLTGGAVLAAVLGLALQETLGNLFAGMALHLEDSFAPGDVIHAGEFFGTVEAVRWRGTRLRTFNNSIVIVPNSVLARERVEIFPRTNLNARVLQIGIDYNVPPATVLNILVQAASNVEGVAHEIPAFARVGGFGDSAAIYEIKYHLYDYAQRDRIDADIRKAVWYALRRNGIAFPLPIRSLQRYQPPE
ncbi:MAG TPA: mechanosensitive ion channel family protein, partial [Thermoanaerobaculia bacterium]|nr:mechanosensitive ion channel family protein [Thermoanaerobaculia bacterium]